MILNDILKKEKIYVTIYLQVVQAEYQRAQHRYRIYKIHRKMKFHLGIQLLLFLKKGFLPFPVVQMIDSGIAFDDL